MASDRPNGCFHPSSRWLTKAINAPIADGLRMFRTRVELQRSQRVEPDGVSSESAEGIGTATKLSASTSTSTTLADSLTPLLAASPFLTRGAGVRGWSSEDLEKGVAHGGKGGLRGWTFVSFFPASLF